MKHKQSQNASVSADDSTKQLAPPPLGAAGLSALLYELLRDAVRMENIELIKFFLEQGADVNVQDRYGKTALYRAMEELSGSTPSKRSERLRN